MIKNYKQFLNESYTDPYDYPIIPFENLLGKIFIDISINNNCIKFETDNGEIYELIPDANDEVGNDVNTDIEDINGDIKDLLNSPILQSKEATNNKDDFGQSYQESFLWTFYKLSTVKGYVVIRYYGRSNGYYSEKVTLYKVK